MTHSAIGRAGLRVTAMSAFGFAAAPACSASDTSSDAAGHSFGDSSSPGGRGDTDGFPEAGGEVGVFESGGLEPSADEQGGEELPPFTPGSYPRCPADFPPGWMFCEDFEDLDTVADLYNVFFDYQDGDGAFMLHEGDAASGMRAMRATYFTGVEAAGFLSVSFGENPISDSRAGYERDRTFDEIYWRVRVRTQLGWPETGPHNLARVSSFADANWGQAVVAEVGSAGDGVTLQGLGASCVKGGTVDCAGIDDAGLEPFEPLLGQMPVFSAASSGVWQCIEGHIRLNTPGSSDGVFEFWVDEVLDARNDQLDWRGEWADYGLNLFSLENFWVGGAPSDLTRSIDDLVIATERVGC